MIMALGALISGYLGFRRYGVWVPTAIACVIVAIQFAMFQVGNNPDVRIEIYVFSSDQAWVNYEDIQADIFDHIFAVLPEFGLRPFQNPAGAEIASAIERVRLAITPEK